MQVPEISTTISAIHRAFLTDYYIAL